MLWCVVSVVVFVLCLRVVVVFVWCLCDVVKLWLVLGGGEV